MKFSNNSILLLLLFLPVFLYGQKNNIHVGLFHDQLLRSVVFSSGEEDWEILADGKVFPFTKNEILYLGAVDSLVLVRNSDKYIGAFHSIEFSNPIDDSSLGVKPVVPALDYRHYQGKLIVSVRDGFFSIINQIDLEFYLAGVIAAEAGSNGPLEYYKTQAILSRTYYYANSSRHKTEGYHLCDGTHCQVYHGMSLIPDLVFEAVAETKGLVILDENNSFILPAYHSNSGGETADSHGTWILEKDYLVSKSDPWSLKGRNVRWERSLLLDDWISYLLDNGVSRSWVNVNELTMNQVHRKEYYVVGNDSLKLTQIREDFRLRSDFFDLEVKNDSIYIHGRGYGHGIGLSQEGAMVMAKEGYWFPEIIKFYFPGVKIKNFTEGK